MRNRRRTIVAALALLSAGLLLQQSDPLIVVDGTLRDRAPATAQAALDLGLLGTVAISWTVNKLR